MILLMCGGYQRASPRIRGMALASNKSTDRTTASRPTTVADGQMNHDEPKNSWNGSEKESMDLTIARMWGDRAASSRFCHFVVRPQMDGRISAARNLELAVLTLSVPTI